MDFSVYEVLVLVFGFVLVLVSVSGCKTVFGSGIGARIFDTPHELFGVLRVFVGVVIGMLLAGGGGRGSAVGGRH